MRDRDPPPPEHHSQNQEQGPLVSLDELLATALGAALAALLLSRLGVAGTIVGAALTPVIITLTNALVSRELRRRREALRAITARGAPSLSEFFRPLSRRQLLSALLTAMAAFAMAAAGITVAEALVDKPVNRWGRDGGSGYTFGGRESRQSSPSSNDTTTPTTTGGGESRERSPSSNTTTPRTTKRTDRHPRMQRPPATTPERTAPQRTEGEPGAAETTPGGNDAPTSPTPAP